MLALHPRKLRSMKILHVADLHLATGERDYSLAVLDELVAVASGEQVGLLLVAGDLFDSYGDAEALRDEVAARMERLPPGCRCVYVPGNHEKRGASERRHIGLLSLGRAITVASDVAVMPISNEVEVLTVPHAERYDDYQSWVVPPKKATARIAVAHATVAGLSYVGPGVEEGGGVIDPDLFAFHQVDYAAMGHIHAGRKVRLPSGLVIAYPGSSRVWRSGEEGERCALVIDLAYGLEPVPVPLAAAGQWRAIEVPLAQDGSVALGSVLGAARAHDWVEVTLTGVADDDGVRDAAARTIEEAMSRRVRRLEVSARDVMVLAGVAEEPVVRAFLDAWQKRFAAASEAERPAWLLARTVGLGRIVRVVGARS